MNANENFKCLKNKYALTIPSKMMYLLLKKIIKFN